MKDDESFIDQRKSRSFHVLFRFQVTLESHVPLEYLDIY